MYRNSWMFRGKMLLSVTDHQRNAERDENKKATRKLGLLSCPRQTVNMDGICRGISTSMITMGMLLPQKYGRIFNTDYDNVILFYYLTNQLPLICLNTNQMLYENTLIFRYKETSYMNKLYVPSTYDIKWSLYIYPYIDD